MTAVTTKFRRSIGVVVTVCYYSTSTTSWATKQRHIKDIIVRHTNQARHNVDTVLATCPFTSQSVMKLVQEESKEPKWPKP